MRMPFVVLILLFTAMTLAAQSPVVGENPAVQALSESWRADNKGYGQNGMTWLDNFYHGQGALVMSTLQGVKTWLIKYPGDTANVFTWQGGDARIKTGDFNGDGIVDYLDEIGNLYLGIKNGEPPAEVPVKVGRGDIIGDFDRDGYDDMFALVDNSSADLDIARIVFGGPKISEMKTVVIPRELPFDSVWQTKISFVSNYGDIGIISHLGYSDTSLDGYRLYNIRVESVTRELRISLLHEFTFDVGFNHPTTVGISVVESLSGKQSFVALEQIDGSNDHKRVSVYDLSNSIIEKLYSIRFEGARNLCILKHCIESPPALNAAILWEDVGPERLYLQILKGNLATGLVKLSSYDANYLYGHMTYAVSTFDPSVDSLAGLVICSIDQLHFYRGLSRLSGVDPPDTSTTRPTFMLATAQPHLKRAPLVFRYYAVDTEPVTL